MIADPKRMQSIVAAVDEYLTYVEPLRRKIYYAFVAFKTLILAKPIIVVSATALISYFIWYRVSAVRKPRIHGKEGPLRTFITENCNILHHNYWPTWWAVNCHLCTVLRSMIQRCHKGVLYDRHQVTLSDGGLIPLDFDTYLKLSPSSPILLILPGLTGDSNMNYIHQFIQDARISGYRAVVFNQRGNGGVPLTTARLYSATNTEDLEDVIEYITLLYPGTPVVAIGVSLGGIILSHYLSRTGSKSALSAAISISTPLHPASSQCSLENKWFNRKLYIDLLVNNMMKIVRRNSHVLERHPSFDFKRLKRINSLSTFDATITAPLFGYQSEVEYYADACLVDKICKIEIPYIALIAEDDPFIPFNDLPIEQFNENPNTVLILVKHGGHFGFLEGTVPVEGTWMNRANQQFLESLRVFCKMA